MDEQKPVEKQQDEIDKRLLQSGLRLTSKRRQIYRILMNRTDHPSAEEIFIQAKAEMPEISLATVYNCLDALVRYGLIKEVIHEKGATRYCSNPEDHHHFYCTKCGKVYDIKATHQVCERCISVPEGFQIQQFDIVLRGICANCCQKGPHPNQSQSLISSTQLP